MRRDIIDTVFQFRGTDTDMVRMLRQFDPFHRVWDAVDAQRKMPKTVAVVVNYRRA